MKIKYLGIGLLLGALGFGQTACQDDFDAIPESSLVETTDLKANTSILELKTMYWSDETNAVDTITVYTEEQKQLLENSGIAYNADRAVGDRLIVSGRVVSNDYTGNIYKTLVIQDKTAAITIGIDATSLYARYPMGIEVVLDLTDTYIGKYSGLVQLGIPEYSASYGWQINRMPLHWFETYAHRNGRAYTEVDGVNVSNIEPSDTALVTIAEVNSNLSSAAGQRQWQSRLIRINNIKFTEGGATFAELETTVKRYIIDDDGNQLMVYNSGYSNFWSETLPTGYGDIAGILSYFNGSPQLLLIDTDGCMNFGNPTVIGTVDKPYSVLEAIAFEQTGANSGKVWTEGYIVGALKPGIGEVSSADDIQWGAPAIMDNTLVIGQTPDSKALDECLLIQLPESSKLKEYGNLADNPDNLGRKIKLLGRLNPVLGTYGIEGNEGTPSEFSIEGLDVPDENPAIPAGDGSKENPYNPTQVGSLGNPGTNAWVKGYIVGWIDGMTLSTGAQFNNAATSQTNLLIATTPDETDVNNCVPVALPAGSAARTNLNLQANPGVYKHAVALYGQLVKYFGAAGLKEVSEYILDGEPDTPGPTPGGETGDGSADNPYSVADLLGGASGTGKWVTGYIIGCINTENNYAVETSAPFGTTYNLLISDSPTDLTNYTTVQLPYGDLRTDLNLQDNPGNLGKQVSIYGDIASYLQKNGLKNCSAYVWGDKGGTTPGGDDDDDPVTPPADLTGDGSAANPYTVADVKTFNMASGEKVEGIWATGYIVGTISGQVFTSGASFSDQTEVETNLLLAATPDETDVNNCIPVALPAGDVRTALNLKAHPEFYKQQIALYGNIERYFATDGIKSVTKYVWGATGE